MALYSELCFEPEGLYLDHSFCGMPIMGGSVIRFALGGQEKKSEVCTYYCDAKQTSATLCQGIGYT